MQKHTSAGSHLPALGVAVCRLSRSINRLEVVKPDAVRMVGIKEELEHPAVFLLISPGYHRRLVTNT